MQQIIVLIQANWCIYPSSEPPFGGPPSPRGEGLGAAIIGAINYNLYTSPQKSAPLRRAFCLRNFMPGKQR